jgi:hypothetical protein
MVYEKVNFPDVTVFAGLCVPAAEEESEAAETANTRDIMRKKTEICFVTIPSPLLFEKI